AQVVGNLLDNAIKFSPKGGRVEVELSSPKRRAVRLAVRDHGIGIASEDRPHIFERFYRSQPSDQRSGLGLGLYVSREIVELHSRHPRARRAPKRRSRRSDRASTARTRPQPRGTAHRRACPIARSTKPSTRARKRKRSSRPRTASRRTRAAISRSPRARAAKRWSGAPAPRTR